MHTINIFTIQKNGDYYGIYKNYTYISRLNHRIVFSTKIIGNKQMSELSMFDYINGITIGSIAAEMATSLDGKFYYPLTAIVIYTVIMWFISYLTEKKY